ncbi:MAG: SulP family inorganic anion transporter [Chitinophagaceae bacterium]|nr:SulP family inorganic anion transporter [Chitinophagaceae bacterium]
MLAVLFAVSILNMIPYCVLAVILIRTGYNLAKPKMIWSIYKQGREQFIPFIFTVGAILFTDLLIGVAIGVIYSIYFIIKHTYQAGFVVEEKSEGHHKHYILELAMNVSYMNKKKLLEFLDKVPEYSVVEINGNHSNYIDNDVLEIIQNYKSKAHRKHVQLILHSIPEVEVMSVH